jgi:uncharacterized protein YbbK (DUF523 family)
MIIVSACLAGIDCNYKGGNNLVESIEKLVSEGAAIAVCPEQLGGCPTPRMPAEISGGTGADVLDGKCRVLQKNGEDITARYIKGAFEVLKIIKKAGIKNAILKSKSPSCGFGCIYDGSFRENLTQGNGVTAELLARNDIKIVCESFIRP